eukprot:scaffold1522_cov340-Prasinococcus_capsulatus_cf.AAC.21
MAGRGGWGGRAIVSTAADPAPTGRSARPATGGPARARSGWNAGGAAGIRPNAPRARPSMAAGGRRPLRTA